MSFAQGDQEELFRDLNVCEGTVEQIDTSAMSLTVTGITFFVLPTTKIMKETEALADENPIRFSDIKKGDYVNVTNHADRSGRMVADSIELYRKDKFVPLY